MKNHTFRFEKLGFWTIDLILSLLYYVIIMTNKTKEKLYG